MRIVTLISGSGSTLQNLIDVQRRGELAGTLVGVISSKPETLGVERANAAGLPVTIVRPEQNSPKRNSPQSNPLQSNSNEVDHFSERVFAAIESWQPDLVCLAGWLHLIAIPPAYRWRVLNIHPSLLPAFGGQGMYGRHVHKAVLAYGARVSGCTVHFADDTYDTGPIIVQRAVPVEWNDTPETLAARVFAAECEAYPAAINLLATTSWTLDGRRLVISAS